MIAINGSWLAWFGGPAIRNHQTWAGRNRLNGLVLLSKTGQLPEISQWAEWTWKKLEKIEEMWDVGYGHFWTIRSEKCCGCSTILERSTAIPLTLSETIWTSARLRNDFGICYLQRRHLSMSTTCAWGSNENVGNLSDLHHGHDQKLHAFGSCYINHPSSHHWKGLLYDNRNSTVREDHCHHISKKHK